MEGPDFSEGWYSESHFAYIVHLKQKAQRILKTHLKTRKTTTKKTYKIFKILNTKKMVNTRI